MADILDEHGNPIQLTDELGRPVKLTDEHGVPIHLTGVVTSTEDSSPKGGKTTVGGGPEVHGGTHFSPVTTTDVVGSGGPTEKTMPLSSHLETSGAETEKQQLGRTGSSSSSSSEDDGQGGRRKKKKGLMQKIKEKLPGHKNKDQEEVPASVYTATTKVTVTKPAGPPDEPRPEFIKVEHHEEEHEKKGFMEKIKDKLPGHHAR
ncbi:hypothetical protein OSB04_015791 [Centaurea solstitialis]|uniref:Dehydrin n=1 Tax=Centaurea solstitialis TaxID=347529 RepID=A0AA38TD04_9ASTR|nr:hypothetical protein OSB04_015791 [Centaurea solstitialis]